MTTLYLYDDAAARRLEPFALTRPAGELRAGALLIRERWERLFGVRAAGSIAAAHLEGFEEPGAAPVATSAPSGSVIVANSRFAPALGPSDSPGNSIGRCNRRRCPTPHRDDTTEGTCDGCSG